MLPPNEGKASASPAHPKCDCPIGEATGNQRAIIFLCFEEAVRLESLIYNDLWASGDSFQTLIGGHNRPSSKIAEARAQSLMCLQCSSLTRSLTEQL
jgi:hypothetical protein